MANSKDKSFLSENKKLIFIFLVSCANAGITYFSIKNRQKMIEAKASSAYDANDPTITGILDKILFANKYILYNYKTITNLTGVEGTLILNGKDPLGPLNTLYLLNTKMQPVYMLGLASDLKTLASGADYPDLPLMGVMDVGDIKLMIKSREGNQDLILDFFGIADIVKKDLKKVSPSKKYEMLGEYVLPRQAYEKLSGLMTLVASLGNNYWQQRFSGLSRNVQKLNVYACKRANSVLDTQRLLAAVLWALVQDLKIRQKWQASNPLVALHNAIDAMKIDLVGDKIEIKPDKKHLWMIELFKQGAFNCEIPNKNRLFVVDKSYEPQNNQTQRQPPVDLDPTQDLAVFLGGTVFYSKDK